MDNKHQQNWRAANDEHISLDAARDIFGAIALLAVLWAAIGGLLWWSVEILAQ